MQKGEFARSRDHGFGSRLSVPWLDSAMIAALRRSHGAFSECMCTVIACQEIYI